ncbi:hypothetical protein [Thalassococcus lentus]|uniref:Uncharacterized protein n=1 Tax=Thalassococcus lentus TaxID=1210524 RepID=A0ABT4XN94_9RHOB|nr:hypothetical protein [Thalassococcus lentus]MDA7423417.1 hypothetical protein [Thalassococcus lentus]
MKRRDFLALTAGGAAAATLPVPQMAAATTRVAPRSMMTAWATAMARAGNPISHKTLNSALKVSSAEASAIMNRLAAQGVIAAPNAIGVARAVSGKSHTDLSSDGLNRLRGFVERWANEKGAPEEDAPNSNLDASSEPEQLDQP